MEAHAQPATNMRLWEYARELESVVEELIESGGELTPELEAQLDAWSAAFQEKAERVALYIQNLTGLAETAQDEAHRLLDLARARRNAADRLKNYLKDQMESTGETKIETPLIKLWVQRNGRPSIAWTREPEEIPEAFRRIRVELDGNAAYEEWKAGAELPEGFRVEHGTHLRIR